MLQRNKEHNELNTINCLLCGLDMIRTRTEKYCSLHCALWSRVDVLGLDDCWPWTASAVKFGYGIFSFKNKRHKAHRVSAILSRGAMASSDVLHSCDNPVCCNPCHLRWGSHQENMVDKIIRSRHNSVSGSDHYKALVDEEKVNLIKELISQGYRQIDIAEGIGVKRSLIADISAGRTWRKI